MEVVIIGLLGLLIVLQLVLLIKSNNRNNNKDILDKLYNLEKQITKDMGDFKYGFSTNLRDDFKELERTMNENLLRINEKVNERLDINFEKTNKTFTNVLERLSKIDEAQKKIDHLSGDIVSLQSILTDKKTRGIFGEVNLNYILSSIFGENQKNIYQTQYHLSNGAIVDAILFAPEPLGAIGIDSKFPLENYERMTDKENTKEERDTYTKLFKMDVKKHIDAIASKYIIENETAKEAILFLPAEAIFAEIHAYHPDLISYAYQRKVWITSPTTLMSTLSTISVLIKNMERDKYAKIIHEELDYLNEEFMKYRIRWDHLAKNIDSVSKDVKEIHVTTEKITKRFSSIHNVNHKELGITDEEE